ncbi:hypothetical protein DMN91_006128 [Ooceraea biroi]|uniref:Uncharacterized protein n=1 Tax=Ooceraea biroi TaxID=2015173 RepID=A0A3L8DNF2_OOCBI|nr:hypothetical protein DMN91_006128 [Ooceraea biroi]
MDFAATQIYEDEDFLPTQRFSNALEAEDRVQVGTLSINSTKHQIKRGITKIGRLSSCDIVINDAVSSLIMFSYMMHNVKLS